MSPEVFLKLWKLQDLKCTAYNFYFIIQMKLQSNAKLSPLCAAESSSIRPLVVFLLGGLGSSAMLLLMLLLLLAALDHARSQGSEEGKSFHIVEVHTAQSRLRELCKRTLYKNTVVDNDHLKTG